MRICKIRERRKISGPASPLCLRGLSGLLGIDLLAVLVVSDSRGRGTVAAAFARAHAHDLAVDGATDAVLKLQVHLGDSVVGEDGCVGNITCRLQSMLGLGNVAMFLGTIWQLKK